jgi:hypothetical protein
MCADQYLSAGAALNARKHLGNKANNIWMK